MKLLKSLLAAALTVTVAAADRLMYETKRSGKKDYSTMK